MDNLPITWDQQRSMLTRIALGGSLHDVLRDVILLVEKQASGKMLASILLVSDDGKRLLDGAAPSLPSVYNAAIHGMAIGPGAGSCGTAAHGGEPVFVTDIATDPLWRNFRDLALPHGLAACWSVPIRSADGSVVGTFANYYREPRSPSPEEVAAINILAQTTGVAVERHRSDLVRAKAEADRQLMMQELDHRVKNLFALAQATISLSAQSAGSVAELAEVARGRLGALAAAHGMAVAGPDGEDARPGLEDLVDTILRPYATNDGTPRHSATGPAVALSPILARNLPLAFHELATNAVKYGAFSKADGTVSITWAVEEDALVLRWEERGGPSVQAPDAEGFGSVLLRDAVESQAEGRLTLDWQEEGLSVEICLPMSSAAAH